MNTVTIKIKGENGEQVKREFKSVFASIQQDAERLFAELNKRSSLYRGVSPQFRPDRQLYDDKLARQAALDIRKVQAETTNITKQNTLAIRAIERNAHRDRLNEIKAEDRVQKEKINAFLRNLKQIQSESRSGFSDVLSGSFFGSLAANAISSFIGTFSSIYTQISQIWDAVTDLSQKRASALLGLQSVVVSKGFSFSEAESAVKNLRLVKAGIVELGEASTALKNLLATGFSLPESIKLLEAFSDTAAFGKQQALGFGEAIRGATEGIKNGNSILVDNVGLTKNLSVILKEMGKSEKDVMNVTTDLSVRQALLNGLLKEAAINAGDANKLMTTYGGSVAGVDQSYKQLQATIGDYITQNQSVLAANTILREQIDEVTASLALQGKQTTDTSDDWLKMWAQIRVSTVGGAQVITGVMQTAFGYVRQSLFGVLGLFAASVESAVSLTIGAIASIYNPIAFTLNQVVKLIDSIPLESLAGVPFGSAINAIRGRELPTIELDQINQLGKVSYPLVQQALKGTESLINGSKNILAGFEKIDLGLRDLDTEIEFRRNNRNRLTFQRFDSSKVKTNSSSEIQNLLNKGTSSVSKSKDIRLSSKAEAVIDAANKLGISPLDLATIISYETRGTFSPSVIGGKGNNYQGLIQFGEAERRQFGVYKGQSFENQITTSVVDYFRTRFNSVGRTTQGATLLDLYKTVNGGNPNVSANASDGNGTIAQHVARMSVQHRRNALKLFGGSATNIPPNTSGSDYESQLRAVAGFDNQLFQKENFEKYNKFFKQFGITPNEQYLQKYTDFLNKDKQLDREKLNIFDVKKQFPAKETSPNLTTTEGQLEGINKLRSTLGESYLASLKESLNITAKTEEITSRYTAHYEIVTELIKDAYATQELTLQNLNEQYNVQQALFSSEKYRNYEKDIAILEEKLSLERSIFDLENEIANNGINDALKIQAAYLQDIVELRGREQDAIIAANRAQLELTQQTQLSANQIRANVLSALASQRTLNEAISEGILKIGESATSFLDKKLGALGNIPLLGDLLKFGNQQIGNRITTTILGKIFPPEIANQFKSTGNPLLDENVKQTDYLKKIYEALQPQIGGLAVPSGVGGGGFLPALLNTAFGGGNLDNRNGINSRLIFNATGGNPLYNVASDVISGSQGSGSNRVGGGGILSQLFGKGGIFGDKGFGNNVGTYGAIGGGISLLGSLFGNGRLGSSISGVGQGLGIGASIGSIIPGIGTAIGAGIGALVGGIAGLFGGGTQRKQDEVTRTQAYQAVVKEFDEMILKLKFIPPRIDPVDAQSRASSIVAEYTQAMSQLKDKKTREIALREVTATNGIVYRKNEELKAAIAIAQGNLNKRTLNEDFVGEFATGGLIRAKQGGHLAVIGEGGYDEFVLSTNPVYRNRTLGLLSNLIDRLDFNVPRFETGGVSFNVPSVPVAVGRNEPDVIHLDIKIDGMEQVIDATIRSDKNRNYIVKTNKVHMETGR